MSQSSERNHPTPPVSHKGGHERTPGTHVPPDAPDPEAGATGVGAQPGHDDEMPPGDGNTIGSTPAEPLAGPDDGDDR